MWNFGIFVATRLQFDDRPLFGTLAFQNRLEYRNFDFNFGSDFSTSWKNLVRFGTVTPEFKT